MKALLTALNKFQAECPAVEKGKDNPFFKSKYASLDAIQYVIQPFLAKHGLVVTQCNINTETGLFVETRVYHVDSEDRCITSIFPIIIQKNTPQDYGSAVSYARRYSLTGVLNVRVVDESDDDGNTASTESASAPITAKKDNPWLNKTNPDWDKIVDAIKTGKRTIAQLRDAYKVSKAVEHEINNAVNAQ
jgi:hypothetical protein